MTKASTATALKEMIKIPPAFVLSLLRLLRVPA
eukprot:CAMPEP_0197247490 /NCGR_PEP_ID=MMETSP1429-20130617/29228_1 /TAXON_ID=49237 /ORGANISM="Chaetoceros  sp., Strain UNC1202" /LENGTH=32 /DNA_ID= /DNA_START= /DNA_END= /DNA_ORIENTATION=